MRPFAVVMWDEARLMMFRAYETEAEMLAAWELANAVGDEWGMFWECRMWPADEPMIPDAVCAEVRTKLAAGELT